MHLLVQPLHEALGGELRIILSLSFLVLEEAAHGAGTGLEQLLAPSRGVGGVG